MTVTDLADRLTRTADALRRGPMAKETIPGSKPYLEDDFAVGAAMLWAYGRDLLTVADKETFTREELLVCLELISRDAEVFPPGVIEMIANCEGV